MCENVLLVCMSVYHMCARFLLKSEEGFGHELWMCVCYSVGIRN